MEPGIPPVPWSPRHLTQATTLVLAAVVALGSGCGGDETDDGSGVAAGDGADPVGSGGAPTGDATVATTSAATSVASTGSTTASASTTGGGVDVTCSGATPSLSGDVQPILTASCAVTNCHKGASPDKGLDLAEGAAWGELVGVDALECTGDRLRVEPGAPADSYVIAKVLGVDLCSGRRMPPPTRAPLDEAEIQILVDWICNGALDD